MALSIRRAEYFYTTVRNRPGEALRLLSDAAEAGVELLAFAATPCGPDRSQLTLFPGSIERLAALAEAQGLVLDGPHPALIVQGDDRLGALASVHERLFEVKVNVYASTGVTDGKGTFAYLIHVKAEDVDTATAALEQLG